MDGTNEYNWDEDCPLSRCNFVRGPIYAGGLIASFLETKFRLADEIVKSKREIPTNGDTFKVRITWFFNCFSPDASKTRRFAIKSGNTVVPDYGKTIQRMRCHRWKRVGRILHNTRVFKRRVHTSNHINASINVETIKTVHKKTTYVQTRFKHRAPSFTPLSDSPIGSTAHCSSRASSQVDPGDNTIRHPLPLSGQKYPVA